MNIFLKHYNGQSNHFTRFQHQNVASPIYALLSVIKQQMSPFDPFREGGSPKGDNVPFFYRFFCRIASLSWKIENRQSCRWLPPELDTNGQSIASQSRRCSTIRWRRNIKSLGSKFVGIWPWPQAGPLPGLVISYITTRNQWLTPKATCQYLTVAFLTSPDKELFWSGISTDQTVQKYWGLGIFQRPWHT